MKKTLFVYGKGGFGKEVLDIANRMGTFSKIYFIDDFDFDNQNSFASSYVFENINNYGDCYFTIAIGDVNVRIRVIANVLKAGGSFATLIDPTAVISPTAKISEGVIICQLAFVGPDATIDSHCIVNTAAVIGHDIKISEYCVISPSVNIGGQSQIGRNVYLGMGSIVKEGLKIGENAVLGMGSVLHSDLPGFMLAMGNPARPIRKIDDDFRIFS
jgi:sugar O-acyltransferase (sialic acid O-acetyltransferase NeuD family)